MANGGSGSGGSFWRDDEIVVDRDGIPHYTGVQPGLMKEYRRRVLFAYNNLEGSGDDEEKERRSLAKKKARFGLRLVHGLHGQAWKECEELVLTPEKLKDPEPRGLQADLCRAPRHREGRGHKENRGLRELL